MIDFGKYVGIPFETHGRDFNSVDCYGLVRLIMEQEHGIIMDSYTEGYSDAHDARSVQRAITANVTKEVYEVQEPLEGDVIMFRLCGVVAHMGIVINKEGHFIHSIKGTNSCIENFNYFKWNRRIDSYWRINA